MKSRNPQTFKFLQTHTDRRFQAIWQRFQVWLMILPFLPIVAGLGLVFEIGSIGKKQYQWIVRRPLNWGLAIFSLWLIGSSSFAFNSTESLVGLANFLPFFLLFVTYSELIKTPAQLRSIAWIIVSTSLPVLIVGFGQMFWNWSGPKQLQDILTWVVDPLGNPVGRMSSIYIYANTLAFYLLIVFALGLGLWIEEWKITNRQKQESALFPSRKVGKRRLQITFDAGFFRVGFLSLVITGSAIAIVLTSSRNAWAIALLAGAAFALYQRWHWLVAVITGVAGGIFWAAFGPQPVQQWLRNFIPAYFWARISDQLYPDRVPSELRTTQWEFAWEMTQQRPWTGWGLRSFTPLYEAKTHVFLGHPHNLLLMLTAETGIPAALFFCSLIGWIMAQGVLLVARSSFKQPQDRLMVFTYLIAFAACMLFNILDVSMFNARVNILGWLLLSAICGVVYHQRK